jgi:Asp-tRNA(Asn)/Glu-tRNA(Gln) amidotransferase A subunit family amidase
MTATRLLELLDRREVSAVQLARLFIERCRMLNPRINAVVTLAQERALAEAAESDRRRSNSEAIGALEGLPFTVNNTLATQGELRPLEPGMVRSGDRILPAPLLKFMIASLAAET